MNPNVVQNYRPELDGFRALAIIPVVAYHAGVSGFSGGFVGVDLFFVISGYLITGILAHQAVHQGRLDLKTFYARRIRRLMPAALLMLVVLVTLYTIFIPPLAGDYQNLARSIIANAFFVSNFYFFAQKFGYFDEPITTLPLLHTWSLSVEEQYYVLCPMLMLGILSWYHRKARSASIQKCLQHLLWVLVIGSLCVGVTCTSSFPRFSFYLLPTRIWEFGTGALLALYLPQYKSQFRPFGNALASIGVVACVASIVWLKNDIGFPGAWALLPVLGAASLIAGLALNAGGVWNRFFKLRPLVWIGLVSYGWYLWHWPLLSIYKIYSLGDDTLTGRVTACLMALLLAWLSFRFVEQPIRECRHWPFIVTKSTLWAGVGVTGLTLLLAGSLFASRQYQESHGPLKLITAARRDSNPFLDKCLFMMGGVKEFSLCGVISKENRPVIVLWGDSHADHFMPMLVAQYPDYDVQQFTRAGCPPIVDQGAKVHAYNEDCRVFNSAVIQHLLAMAPERLKGVYVSARWPSYFGITPISRTERSQAGDRVNDPQMYQTMETAFDNTLRHLNGLSAPMTIIGPTPELVYPAPKCMALRSGSTCNVPYALVAPLLDPVYETLTAIARKNPQARVLDVRPYFCDATSCVASKSGIPLFRDNDHITATTARDMAQLLNKPSGFRPN